MAYDIGPKIGIEGEAEFRRSITDINTTMRTLGTEMQAVASQFDKNDKSQEAYAAKNEVLNKQLDLQKKKLSELEKGLKAAGDKYGENDKVTQGWRQAVNKATADLNNMERELGSNAKAMDNLGEEMDDVSGKAGKFQGALGKMGKGLASIGGTIGKAAITGIKAVGTAAIGAATGLVAMTENTREYRNDLSKLEQNTKTAGNSFDVMKARLSGLTALTGQADSAMEALSNLLAAGFTDKQMTEALDALSGAIIKFPDTLKIESLADSLQETIATGKGAGQFAELIERMGGSLDDFNTGLAGAATEAEKQKYALDWLAKSGLPAISEEYKKTNEAMLSASEAQFKLNDSMATLSKSVEPAIASLKGGFANVLSSIIGVVTGAKGANEELKVNIQSLASNGLSQIKSMMPMILAVFLSLIPTLITGISGMLPELSKTAVEIILLLVRELTAAIPKLLPIAVAIIMALVNGFVDMLPELMSAALQILMTLVNAIKDNLPQLINAAVTIILTLVDALLEALPELIPVAIEMLVTLIKGILDSLPKLIEKIPVIIETIVTTIVDNLPLLIDAAIEIILALVDALLNNLPLIIEASIKIMGALLGGIIQAIPTLLTAIPKIFTSIRESLANVNWGELGMNIINGIVSGVANAAVNLVKSVRDAGQKALDGVKDLLGIKSPSKIFEDQVGFQIGAGMARGISRSAKEVQSALSDINNDITNPDNFPTHGGGSGTGGAGGETINVNVPLSIDGQTVTKKTGTIQVRKNKTHSRAIGVMA